MGRAFALKNVRIFYTKTDRMKFVSHLDMNRLMSRIIMRADIPVWYTEGFNQRIYINYAVPLSLGFEGLYEIIDIRLTDDNYPFDTLPQRLNGVSVPGIEFIRAAEPCFPTKDICFAGYRLQFDSGEIFPALEKFLSQESVICQKRDKRGGTKDFDIIPNIKSFEFKGNTAQFILAAGNNGSLNPSLVMSAFFEQTKTPPTYFTTVRYMLYDGNMNEFV